MNPNFQIISLHPEYVRDLSEIEELCFEDPWDEEDFQGYTNKKEHLGMILKEYEIVHGFLCYRSQRTRYRILNFAVHPDSRRMNIGTELINRLKNILFVTGKKLIQVEVRESMLTSQLFFRSCGFKCVSIEEDYFEGGDTAYIMQYHNLKQPS